VIQKTSTKTNLATKVITILKIFWSIMDSVSIAHQKIWWLRARCSLTGTFIKKTWTSPNGKTHNQIDHVLIDRRWHSNVLDLRSLRGADCDTDHNLVIACSIS